MSGHGGGGTGGGEPGPVPSCESLTAKVPLNSPDPKVIGALKPQDILQVRLQKAGGPVLVVTKTGKVAGSITSTLLARLIRCIEQGFEYEAVVLSVKGAMCEVQIRVSH